MKENVIDPVQTKQASLMVLVPKRMGHHTFA